MLVLSRQKNESIFIGDDIEIMIVDVNRNRVKLGINAPEKIPVHRKEIYERIKRNKLGSIGKKTGQTSLKRQQ